MVAQAVLRRDAVPDEGGESQLYLTCVLAGKPYLLSASAVREVEEVGVITPVPMTPSWLRGVMNLRGVIVEVVDLAHFLGLTPESGFSTEALICSASGVRGTGDEELVALAVDAVSTIRQMSTTEILPLPDLNNTEATPYLLGLCRQATATGEQSEFVGVLDLMALLQALPGSSGLATGGA